MMDLNAFVSGPLATYVTLTVAAGINDNGWIAADGIDSRTGQTHAYLLRPTVPFSTFSAKLDIHAGTPPGFDLNGNFTLGAGTDGIKPLSESVVLKIRTFSTTIPSGSFKTNSKEQFVFQGVVNGVSLQAQITPTSTNTLAVKVDGNGLDLTRLTNPVTLVLTIGNDSGSTAATAGFG